MAQTVKHLPTMRETWVRSLGWEDPLEKEMATHSSTLAWRIPWMKEPGGYSPWGRKESDTTERLHSPCMLGTTPERMWPRPLACMELEFHSGANLEAPQDFHLTSSWLRNTSNQLSSFDQQPYQPSSDEPRTSPWVCQCGDGPASHALVVLEASRCRALPAPLQAPAQR